MWLRWACVLCVRTDVADTAIGDGLLCETYMGDVSAGGYGFEHLFTDVHDAMGLPALEEMDGVPPSTSPDE